MSELKPCPCGKNKLFAGSFDEIIPVKDEWSGGFGVACSIKYGGCGINTGCFDTLEEAIKKWNTRADDLLPIESAPKDGTEILGYRVEQTIVKYYPKGSMCSACAHVFDDCSHLDFSKMRVLYSARNGKNGRDIVNQVKCTNFERKGD